jgi:PadR family transcriptional regulator PadR
MIAAGIKRGTAELAVLSILQGGPRHGYEIARRIEHETKGSLRFTLAALYPMLYRLEKQKWIRGAWETSPTGRRRRRYRLTPEGKQKISPLRKEWSELFTALQRLAGVSNA